MGKQLNPAAGLEACGGSRPDQRVVSAGQCSRLVSVPKPILIGRAMLMKHFCLDMYGLRLGVLHTGQ